MKLMESLEKWYACGWIRAIDMNLARYVMRATEDEVSAVIAGLTSYQLGRGHPRLDVSNCWQDPEQVLALPPEHSFSPLTREATSPHDVITRLGTPEAVLKQLTNSAATQGEDSPLVIAGNCVYLRRYWRYEQVIKHGLAQLMQTETTPNEDRLRPLLTQLFGEPDSTISWQRMACALATRSLFSIITGGPGTGKTYTVVRLIATLQALSPQPLRIKLAAPTGKAAARMTESIRAELPKLNQSGIQFPAPDEATTLHRLLGTQPHSRAFRHHRTNPLALDVLIVDEASMVDVEMMAAIVEALPSGARLILLGDKDQLASVEAGAVLGQLCRGADAGSYAPELAAWLGRVSGQSIPKAMQQAAASNPYLQHVVMLRTSRRFNAEEGIGKLAHEVNQQQTSWLQKWLSGELEANEIHYFPVRVAGEQRFRQFIERGFADYMKLLSNRPDNAADIDSWAAQLLTQLTEFQVLVAVREGEWGVRELNQKFALWLHAEALRGGVLPTWYYGRPIMITHNDYSLNVRNGDIGVVLQRAADEPLRVALWSETKGAESRVAEPKATSVRWLLPSRLTQVESVYAMTVHKSQGSEFKHTVLVVPDRDSPVLTKELVYTGITRAKQQFTLVAAAPEVVETAVLRRIERSGGL
ncbi:exodeoxyribonuclease V subunit alpha [Pseudidiomarina aestuarii]|uniref:RecBCD enzyme subunit RecD n=1 Tax=Pseudidiomarina aestuarii TaxID=624146 RepID=A0A7Z7ET75_9GAMM|nr:exodeoxyribonuclease V subunit alpha [Pseudidiomarina aestuarii]RUO39536.1 exodeoxyribonuclease V subunit alpha [Pseudidiomarina aestuarii]